MAFRGGAIGSGEGHGGAVGGARDRGRAAVPVGEVRDPHDHAPGRDFYPASATSGRMFHYALPYGVYYPY